MSLFIIMFAVDWRDMFGAKILIIMTDLTKLSFAERIKLKQNSGFDQKITHRLDHMRE